MKLPLWTFMIFFSDCSRLLLCWNLYYFVMQRWKSVFKYSPLFLHNFCDDTFLILFMKQWCILFGVVWSQNVIKCEYYYGQFFMNEKSHNLFKWRCLTFCVLQMQVQSLCIFTQIFAKSLMLHIFSPKMIVYKNWACDFMGGLIVISLVK